MYLIRNLFFFFSESQVLQSSVMVMETEAAEEKWFGKENPNVLYMDDSFD